MDLLPLHNIFDIEYGNQFDFAKMSRVDDGVGFISRSRMNFGIVGKVEPILSIEPYPAGAITVTLGGTYLLSSFIQPFPFYTAQNVKVLTPKVNLSGNVLKVLIATFVHGPRSGYLSTLPAKPVRQTTWYHQSQ